MESRRDHARWWFNVYRIFDSHTIITPTRGQSGNSRGRLLVTARHLRGLKEGPTQRNAARKMSGIRVFTPNKPGITPEQYQQAKERYLQGDSARDIAKDLACKRQLLDTRFSRDGLPAIRNSKLAEGREGRTKAKLAECCENLATNLVERPAKGAEGMNLQADTLQKVTKSASILHGWGESMTVAVIVAGDCKGEARVEEQPEPIDI